ncbi:hypothetical protein HPP92_020702 [Vanilla planifolia]|uniref:Mitochondrial inner membrane protein OXA1-like n=1 Tax=Vanilla planifolia TaxID=51239 RepID=A0A835Q162_VANPL|nr:hypothetical protein HPP92_020702 [Vanilla planifolia]
MVQKVPSFKGGGAYWFTDLTTPDTMYIFPALTALSFLATVELNMQEGLEGNPTAKVMKNIFRVLGILTVPFTANFPKAIFCYWMTSNLFSLAYGFAIKRPLVRKFLNLPLVRPQPNSPPQPNFSLSGSNPVRPLSSTTPEKGSEAARTPGVRVSSSTVINQRIRNLEKAVKPPNQTQKR